MKRVHLIQLGVIAALLGSSVLVTKAYFSSVQSSPDTTFSTGSLEITLDQKSGLQINNWLPGEIHQVVVEAQNTGSVPVYLQGYVDGAWDDGQLSTDVVSIVRLERNNGFGWIDIWSDPQSLSAIFFLSSTGAEQSMIELGPQESVDLRVSLQLDPSATDEYQLHQFVGSFHLAAKQITTGATWPAQY